MKLEAPAEVVMREMAVEEWNLMEEIKREAKKAVKSGEVANVTDILFEEEEEVVEEERREKERLDENDAMQKEFVVHVPLPDEREIERMVVEKKKLELLSKYTSENFLEEQTEAKSMLNINR